MTQSRTRMTDMADANDDHDAALGRRLARGDEQAFDEVVRCHSPAMKRLARRLLAWRQADADDVVQEVFIQVYRKRAAFRGDSALKTWLTRMTVNCCRALQRRKSLSLGALWRALRPEPCDPVGNEETATAVRTALRRLPARQREVVVMYYLEQMPTAEVAAVLRLSTGAVNVLLHRARRRLEPMLADYRGTDDV